MRKSPQSTSRWASRSMRPNESSRLMLLVITASTAWILFNSSAEIASSSIVLNNSSMNVSHAATISHTSDGQHTTDPTSGEADLSLNPQHYHSSRQVSIP